MAYTINKTDGSVLTVVPDGTINNNTSVFLFGKNFTNYGEFLNENFVRLLECGANTAPPINPLVGELWFDKDATLLKVFTGVDFRPISGAIASSTPPTNNTPGTIWWDTEERKMYSWDGTEQKWIFIGGTAGAGIGDTGAFPEVITDTAQVEHVVVKMYVDDVLISIYSKDAEFTPLNPITGFATIKPGLNLSNIAAFSTVNDIGMVIGQFQDFIFGVEGPQNARVSYLYNVTAGGKIKFGTSANQSAVTINNDGSVEFTQSISGTSATFTGGVSAGNFSGNGAGLTDLNASNLSSGTVPDARLTGNYTGLGDLIPLTDDVHTLGSSTLRWKEIYCEKLVGEVDVPPGSVITGDGSGLTDINASNLSFGTVPDARIVGTYTELGNLVPDLDNTRTLGLSNNRWGTVHAVTVNSVSFSGGSFSGNGAGLTDLNADNLSSGTVPNLRITGDYNQVHNFLPRVTQTYNLGSATFKWNQVHATTFAGTATTALYADLAEKYSTPTEYSVGTVIVVSENENYDCESSYGLEQRAIGVISENPAILMNSKLVNGQAVALKGRVPVRVVGPIQKGQNIVSNIGGTAIYGEKNSFGIALETNLSEYEKLVECVVL